VSLAGLMIGRQGWWCCTGTTLGRCLSMQQSVPATMCPTLSRQAAEWFGVVVGSRGFQPLAGCSICKL
jgi:hypothetical protein